VVDYWNPAPNSFQVGRVNFGVSDKCYESEFVVLDTKRGVGWVMGRNRFVNTNPTTRETVKVELSDGDWVLFKKVLSNGERRRISSAAFGNLKGSLAGNQNANEIVVDWESLELDRVFTWLHGWSFTDASGKPVQLNKENVGLLDNDTFEEIKALLDAHVQSKEKNGLTPATNTDAGTTTAPST
jgi:hypothetical protein